MQNSQSVPKNEFYLAVEYNYETEKFDRSIPHTFVPALRCVVPHNARESAQFATALKRQHAREICGRGLDPATYHHWRQELAHYTFEQLSEVWARLNP